MDHWTTGQVSNQCNVSVRTLRYYDQIGLLTPSYKEDNGRRYYSEEDLFTLEKITLLKSLMLPLDEIQNLLDKLSYPEILRAHYNHLQEQLTLLQTSISNTTSLINMIDLEGSLSWERISHMVKTSKQHSRKWIEYFQDDEKQFLEQMLPSLGNSDRITQHYVTLLRRIEWCEQHSILPETAAGYQIGCELIAITNETFEGNEQLMNKFWEVRKMPSATTGLYPLPDSTLEFADRCMVYAEQLRDKEKE